MVTNRFNSNTEVPKGPATSEPSSTTDGKAEFIIKRFERLSGNRTNWEQLWQEVLKYVTPRKAWVTRKRETQGERPDNNLFDTTARRANQILAAGFHGNMTNPSTKWFNLRLADNELNKIKEIKTWLADSENKIMDVLNASNFNEQIHEAYTDLGSVGTAVLLEEEDAKEVIRFKAIFIEEIVIDENAEERVDTVYRKYTMSAKAAKSDSNNMPFESTHVEVDSRKTIATGGFNEFPYMVTRFNKVSNDMYGYSPGVILLPDIKMLNSISKTLIKAAQKIVDPPLIMPHDGFLLPLKTTPGGLNYKLSGNANDKIEPLETKGNIPIGRDMQNDYRNAINSGFFTDLFLLLADRKNMTATEVQERIAEKMIMLGPVIGRLQSELLDPIIDRTFGILLRNNVLLPPPEVLQGREIVVEYVSPLALAQRREAITSVSSLLQLVSGVAGFIPDVIDKIDGDKVVDEAAEIYGVSPDIIRDGNQVGEIRQARAEAEQQAQEIEMAKEAVAADKTISESAKNKAEAKSIGEQ
jgi:hypothetical protein